jgi:hypothetical protein
MVETRVADPISEDFPQVLAGAKASTSGMLIGITSLSEIALRE